MDRSQEDRDYARRVVEHYASEANVDGWRTGSKESIEFWRRRVVWGFAKEKSANVWKV
jgi:hypothetical protein